MFFLSLFDHHLSCSPASTASRVDDAPAKSSSTPFLWLFVTATLVCSGCGTGEEIREYVVKPEHERVFTSDVLRDEFGAIPFEWEVPESWTMAENDQFSKFAWQVGAEGNEGRITLSDLPIAAGLVPQLGRWRRQIGVEPGPQDNPMQNTESLKLQGGTATFVDLKGAKETILGMLIPQASKLWIFKFRGSNAIVDEQREQFRKFCESVKIPDVQGDK